MILQDIKESIIKALQEKYIEDTPAARKAFSEDLDKDLDLYGKEYMTEKFMEYRKKKNWRNNKNDKKHKINS